MRFAIVPVNAMLRQSLSNSPAELDKVGLPGNCGAACGLPKRVAGRLRAGWQEKGPL